MRIARSPVGHFLLMICLLDLVASPPLSALATVQSSADSTCGNWEIAQSQQAKDRRLKLTGLIVSGTDCQATLLMGVDTDLFKIGPHNIGAYSLELQVQSIGAAKTAVSSPIGVVPKPILIWPAFDLRLTSKPDDPTANASVNLLGSVTEVSYASDMALQALTYVVDATGELGGLACAVPKEELAGLTVQSSDVFISAVKMLFRSDWTAAKAELTTILPIFYEKVSDATVGSPLNCLGDALKAAGGSTGFVAQVVAGIVARSSAVIIDLLRYSGQPAAAAVRYTSQQVGNGELAYGSSGGHIWTVNADGTHRAQVGQPGVFGGPVWSPDGMSLAVVESDADSTMRLVILSTTSQSAFRPTDYPLYRGIVSWSPDGRFIAFDSLIKGRYDIYAVSADGRQLINLTHNPGYGYYDSPAWSPDGRHIAFLSNGPDHSWFERLYLVDVQSGQLTDVTGDTIFGLGYLNWRPDGAAIAFVAAPMSRGTCVDVTQGCSDPNLGELFTISADGQQLTQLTNSVYEEADPRWSPDGSRLAFASKRDGNWEIYVMQSDGSNPINVTQNPADDEQPAWSPNGTQLAFVSNRDGNRQVYRLDLATLEVMNLSHDPGGASAPNWRPTRGGVAITPVTPVAVPSARAPWMGNFNACQQPCDGTNADTLFSGGMTKIYAQWDFTDIPPGADYVRTWSSNNELWVKYACAWPGPASGTQRIMLAEPGGLRSGTWELAITVNGVVLLRQDITLKGDYSYFSPVGTLAKCWNGP